MLADVLNGDCVSAKLNTVINVNSSDVFDHGGEVLCRDVGADRVRVNIFGGATGTVGSEEYAAFEDEVLCVLCATEPVQERLENVPGQEFLCGGWLARFVPG